jgi:glutathione S-transferase
LFSFSVIIIIIIIIASFIINKNNNNNNNNNNTNISAEKNSTSMITVHHLEHSQSFRVVWLLEELGMQYELKTYKRDSEHNAPNEYKDLSPLGTSPVITSDDWDANGDGDAANDKLIMCESNAILEYLLDLAAWEGMCNDSAWRPSIKSAQRRDYLFWFHAMQGTLQPLLQVDSLFRIIPSKVPFPISSVMGMISSKTQQTYVKPRLDTFLTCAETHLESKPHFAGDPLTLADITAIYPMDAAFCRYPELKEKYPHCQAWLTRVSKRPAFQRAQSKVEEKHVSLAL